MEEIAEKVENLESQLKQVTEQEVQLFAMKQQLMGALSALRSIGAEEEVQDVPPADAKSNGSKK